MKGLANLISTGQGDGVLCKVAVEKEEVVW